jgi:hemerythrin-like domain-containing protein
LTVDNILASDHDHLDQLLAGALRIFDRGDTEHAFIPLDLFWARLAMHIRAEHLHVFPALVRTLKPVDDDATVKLIADLKKDHDFFMRELADIIKSMRKINDTSENVAAELKNRLVRIEKRLAAHNELEEKTIYPVTAQLGSAQLSSLVEKELNNIPPRFPKAE